MTDARERFGRLAEREGLATAEEVARALGAQEELHERGRRTRLGEVLVRQGALSIQEVLLILELQAVRIVQCSPCGVQYNVRVRPAPDERLHCRRCDGPLVEARAPSSDTPILADHLASLLRSFSSRSESGGGRNP